MIDLSEFLNSSNPSLPTRKKISDNIKIATEELVNNGIYLNDLTIHNVMIDTHNNNIQIIDTDDVSCYDEAQINNSNYQRIINYKIKESYKQIEMIDQYICKDKNLEMDLF